MRANDQHHDRNKSPSQPQHCRDSIDAMRDPPEIGWGWRHGKRHATTCSKLQIPVVAAALLVAHHCIPRKTRHNDHENQSDQYSAEPD